MTKVIKSVPMIRLFNKEWQVLIKSQFTTSGTDLIGSGVKQNPD